MGYLNIYIYINIGGSIDETSLYREDGTALGSSYGASDGFKPDFDEGDQLFFFCWIIQSIQG